MQMRMHEEHLLTPSEGEELQEQAEEAAVEDEEIYRPLSYEADDLEHIVAAPEKLHCKHGHPLLPCLLKHAGGDDGHDPGRLALLPNPPPRAPMVLGIRCNILRYCS